MSTLRALAVFVALCLMVAVVAVNLYAVFVLVDGFTGNLTP